MHKAKDMSQRKVLLVVLMIIIGLATRFLFLIPGFPQMPNFTAIGAIALFGSFYLKKKEALLLPLAALWMSDILLNNFIYAEYFASFSLFGDPWVYGGFLAIIFIGFKWLKKLSGKNLIIASFIGAFAFYLITNFSAWLANPIYPKTFMGLMDSYIAGVPFFRNALLGNIFYSFILFGAYDLITVKRLSFFSPGLQING